MKSKYLQTRLLNPKNYHLESKDIQRTSQKGKAKGVYHHQTRITGNVKKSSLERRPKDQKYEQCNAYKHISMNQI